MLGVFQKLVHLLALTPVFAEIQVRSNMTMTMRMTTIGKLKGHIQTPRLHNEEEGNSSLIILKRRSISTTEYDDRNDEFYPVGTRKMTTLEDWDKEHKHKLSFQNSLNYDPKSHRDNEGEGESRLLTSLLMLPFAILEFVLVVLGILISAIVILFVPVLLGLVVYGTGAALGYWQFFGYKIEIQEDKNGVMVHGPPW